MTITEHIVRKPNKINSKKVKKYLINSLFWVSILLYNELASRYITS